MSKSFAVCFILAWTVLSALLLSKGQAVATYHLIVGMVGGALLAVSIMTLLPSRRTAAQQKREAHFFWLGVATAYARLKPESWRRIMQRIHYAPPEASRSGILLEEIGDVGYTGAPEVGKVFPEVMDVAPDAPLPQARLVHL